MLPLRPQPHTATPVPAYPAVGAGIDRRRFLAACARSVLLAGTGVLLGSGAGCTPDQATAGVPMPSNWPQGRVRLASEHPIHVTFHDGSTARIVVAVVPGEGPEPAVDHEAFRRAVGDVCTGFDGSALGNDDARATLEAALRARLDDLLKTSGGSVEAVSVLEAPPEESAHGSSAPWLSSPAPAPQPALAVDAGTAPAPLPIPQGSCLVHGDACPGHPAGR